jgi:hypothetical protein
VLANGDGYYLALVDAQPGYVATEAGATYLSIFKL